MSLANAFSPTIAQTGTSAQETSRILQDSLAQLISFSSKGERERDAHLIDEQFISGSSALLDQISLNPEALQSKLAKSLRIDDEGHGSDGFQYTLSEILRYSLNPSAPGFMDKLYATPLAPGIAAELVLSFLNTNLHVYQVSPVLSAIEKYVTKRLADLFGLRGPRAGGISTQGGSASNMTSIVAARNSLYPSTKTEGNFVDGRRLVLFTSSHGHYSIEKAAQALGFGSSAVVSVPTNNEGQMIASELESLILKSKADGQTPFYINATAGTTVVGSFDPFEQISNIALKYRCWLHIDGAWGGSFVFSDNVSFRTKLKGSQLADSIAINPHKMLGVPLTCSFLLTRDLRLFHEAMTLKAGYLFHEPEERSQLIADGLDECLNDEQCRQNDSVIATAPYDVKEEDIAWTEPNDLADMTLQCGRRGDSLKLFMSWQYYGTRGYATKIESAYDIAIHLNNVIDAIDDLTLVLGPGSKPSCLQVCFYYTPNGKFVFGLSGKSGLVHQPNNILPKDIGKQNTRVTSRISRALILRGFMVDFAPALEGQEDRGSFLRVVVNISTIKQTADRLVAEILATGKDVVDQLRKSESGKS